MKKNLPPIPMVIAGILLIASFQIIGGFVGSAIAWIGLLLFLFGIAGLFMKPKSSDKISDLNYDLTIIFESDIPTKDKVHQAYTRIDAASLSNEEKQEIYENFKASL